MRNLRDTIFYTKTNVLKDFHIYISVPLKGQPTGLLSRSLERNIW